MERVCSRQKRAAGFGSVVRSHPSLTVFQLLTVSLLRQPVVIPADGVEGFVTRELSALTQHFEVTWTGFVIRTGRDEWSARHSLSDIVFVLKLEGSLNYLGAQLEAQTPKRRTTLTSPGVRPTTPSEVAALQRLRYIGFDGPTTQGRMGVTRRTRHPPILCGGTSSNLKETGK
jgi:hypothetical protein